MSDPTTPDEPHDVTRLLAAMQRGEPGAADRVAALVIDDLHRIAERALRHEADGHTLQPTELVSEAFMRLLDAERITWQDRQHFFAVAAQTIRRLLVDHARRRRSLKRDHGVRVTFDEAIAASDESTIDLLALDDALQSLEAVAPRPARVVELRYFGGLSIEATASALEIAPATVKRDWTFARAYLLRAIA